MTIKFSVLGNQENPKGNPVPYHRATQGSKWNPAHKRYLAWKDYVRAEYRKASRGLPFSYHTEDVGMHPILGEVHGRVSIFTRFGPETHADPDNIVKGILDALFNNDKHIDVTTSHTCGNPQPKVEVSIEILEPK